MDTRMVREWDEAQNDCADIELTSEPDLQHVLKHRPGAVALPIGAEQGWEAAVVDHFRAVAVAGCVGRRLVAEIEQATLPFGAPSDLWLLELPPQ